MSQYDRGMDPGTVTTANVITWLIGGLQALVLFILAAFMGKLREHRSDIVALQQQMAKTREEMLNKDDWREDMRQIFARMDSDRQASDSVRQAMFAQIKDVEAASKLVAHRADAMGCQMGDVDQALRAMTTSVESVKIQLAAMSAIARSQHT